MLTKMPKPSGSTFDCSFHGKFPKEAQSCSLRTRSSQLHRQFLLIWPQKLLCFTGCSRLGCGIARPAGNHNQNHHLNTNPAVPRGESSPHPAERNGASRNGWALGNQGGLWREVLQEHQAKKVLVQLGYAQIQNPAQEAANAASEIRSWQQVLGGADFHPRISSRIYSTYSLQKCDHIKAPSVLRLQLRAINDFWGRTNIFILLPVK